MSTNNNRPKLTAIQGQGGEDDRSLLNRIDGRKLVRTGATVLALTGVVAAGKAVLSNPEVEHAGTGPTKDFIKQVNKEKKLIDLDKRDASTTIEAIPAGTTPTQLVEDFIPESKRDTAVEREAQIESVEEQAPEGSDIQAGQSIKMPLYGTKVEKSNPSEKPLTDKQKENMGIRFYDPQAK